MIALSIIGLVFIIIGIIGIAIIIFGDEGEKGGALSVFLIVGIICLGIHEKYRVKSPIEIQEEIHQKYIDSLENVNDIIREKDRLEWLKRENQKLQDSLYRIKFNETPKK